MKQKKGIGMWLPIVVLAIMVAVGIGAFVRAAGNQNKTKNVSPSIKEEQEQEETKKDQETIDTGTQKEEVAVILGINKEDKIVTAYLVEKEEEQEFTYTGATRVLSRFDSEMTMPQLELGEVVLLEYNEKENKLICVKEDKDCFRYKGAADMKVDRLDKIITAGGQKYRYGDGLVILSHGQKKDIQSLNEKDIVTIRAKEENILSIVITKGHGTLTFVNYEDFIGGSLEVGYHIFCQVTEDMEMTLREGGYKLKMTNGDLEVNKYITIVRDETLTMDFDTYRNEITKNGAVTFEVTPYHATLTIDDKAVDTDKPVTLPYGEYVVEAKLEGYETLTRLLTVDSSSMTIQINLVSNSNSNSNGKTENKDNTNSEEADEPEIGDSNSSSEGEDTINNENSGVLTDNYILIQKPEGAFVYFDEEYVGIAPVQIQKVTGEHQVTFKRDGYITKSYTIEIENDGENPILSFPNLTPQ